jgi:hypothetical protein
MNIYVPARFCQIEKYGSCDFWQSLKKQAGFIIPGEKEYPVPAGRAQQWAYYLCLAFLDSCTEAMFSRYICIYNPSFNFFGCNFPFF